MSIIKNNVSCSLLYAVLIGVTVSAPHNLNAQRKTPTLRTSLEVTTTGGFLKESTKENGLDKQSPLLSSINLAVPLRLQWKNFTAQGKFGFTRASVRGKHELFSSSSFSLTSKNRNISTSIGVESRIGESFSSKPGALDTGLGRGFDTLSISRSELLRVLDIVGSVAFDLPNSSVKIVAGVPAKGSRSSWLGLEGMVGLGNRSALVVTTRYQSRNTRVQAPAVTLGFRTAFSLTSHSIPVASTTKPATGIKPANSAAPFTVKTETHSDSLHISIYLPDAKDVALVGDATTWDPITLSRTTDGWWHIRVPLPAAKVSRIQIRVDNGEWGAIPGLPKTRDEYGGSASLLSIAMPQ